MSDSPQIKPPGSGGNILSGLFDALLELSQEGSANSLTGALRRLCITLDAQAALLYEFSGSDAAFYLGMIKAKGEWCTLLPDSEQAPPCAFDFESNQILAAGNYTCREQVGDGLSTIYTWCYPLLSGSRFWGILQLDFSSPPTAKEYIRCEAIPVFAANLAEFLAGCPNTGARLNSAAEPASTNEGKSIEEVLLESRRMFDMAIENAGLGIWQWDVANRSVAYNDFFSSLMGYQPGEINGPVEDYRALIHPEDLWLLDGIKERIQITGIFELEYRMRDKAGRYRWLYDRGQVTHWGPDGKMLRASGITIEITRRKEMELALRQSEAINKAILNALPDLKFRINAAGYFLDYFANREGGAQPLLEPDEFLDKHIRDALPGYLAEAICENLKLALQSQQLQYFEYPLFLGESLHYYEARISAINEQEAIAVVRDITALKHAQQELHDKLLELDSKNQKLEEYIDSNFQLENFAHTVSHDLREPARTVNSFAKLLLHKYDGRLDEDAQTYLNFVASGANDMHDLIESLLEYSRYSTEGYRFVEELNIEELMQSVLAALHELIDNQQAVIETFGLPTALKGNRTGFIQLFQNLISNAIKFCKPNTPPQVVVQATDEGQRWLFCVKDNGIGIEAQYHQQIFLLFRRLHSKRQYQGSGIGLSLCQRIVEQHGGRIWVESEAGQGARFWFTVEK
jgi:PAS domain S-box-containing protein